MVRSGRAGNGIQLSVQPGLDEYGWLGVHTKINLFSNRNLKPLDPNRLYPTPGRLACPSSIASRQNVHMPLNGSSPLIRSSPAGWATARKLLTMARYLRAVSVTGFGTALGHCLGVNEVGSYAQGEGSGTEEVFSGGERDASGWNELDLGQRGLEAAEVRGSAHGAGGEDLDDIGAGLPSSDDLGGGERAGERGDGVAVAHVEGGEVQGGRDDELGSLENAHAGGFGVEHGAGAEEEVGTGFGEAAHDVDGSGDRHGDLEHVDAAGGDSFGKGKRLVD